MSSEIETKKDILVKKIKASIETMDIESFLYYYLELMELFHSITVPNTLKKDDAKIQWEECIPKYIGTLPEAFLEKLTLYYIEIAGQLQKLKSENISTELKKIIQSTSYKKQPPTHYQKPQVKISTEYKESKAWNPFKKKQSNP